MELIAAVLIAGPLGYFAGTQRQGLIRYLILWAIIFPIQCAVVGVFSDDLDPLYFLFNAIILAAGIGLNRLGRNYGERKRDKQVVVAA